MDNDNDNVELGNDDDPVYEEDDAKVDLIQTTTQQTTQQTASIFDELLVKDNAMDGIISCPSPHDNDVVASSIIISCVICGINQISTTLFPCMHCCMCDSCAFQFSKVSNVCPICRCGVKQVAKIYITHK